MASVWTFCAGWTTMPEEQPAFEAHCRPAAHEPAPPPSRASEPDPAAAAKTAAALDAAPSEPARPKCARTTTTTSRRRRAVPSLAHSAPLWCGRLNATFAARVLPPAPATPPKTRGLQGDLHYRNPAGQIVTRPTLTPQEANHEMSSIEWAVRHILRPKYPKIHHELIIAALEYKGDIAPGADPDFPNSVLATVPPEPAGNGGATAPAEPGNPEPRP